MPSDCNYNGASDDGPDSVSADWVGLGGGSNSGLSVKGQ